MQESVEAYEQESELDTSAVHESTASRLASHDQEHGEQSPAEEPGASALPMNPSPDVIWLDPTAQRGRYVKSAEGSLTRQKAAENDGTMVTVVCITYGHEDYIAQALDSFLEQQTDFKFRIFVGEDCGSDGTADIIRGYAERHPDVIVPFIREQNLGPKRNLIDLCQRADSPYIALCEGDDYWVDPLKLQKQFEYMEAHPKIRVSATKTEILATPESHVNSWFNRQPDGRLYYPDSQPSYRGQHLFSPADLLQNLLCHTSSLFYRWNYDLDVPNWYYEGVIGDWSLLLMQTGRVRVGYIPEVTSAYRVNDSSTHYNSDRTAHFLETRLDWINGLTGFLAFAEVNFKNYPLNAVRAKIELETANYLSAAIRVGDFERISAFIRDMPEAARIALSAYISSYRDRRHLVRELTWGGYVQAVRKPRNRRLLGRIMRPTLRLQAWWSRLSGKARNFGRFFTYWTYASVRKRPNLWVFTSFRASGYLDNSRHLFEYVCANHPEIDAVWLARDKGTVERVREDGHVAYRVGSREAKEVLMGAGLAFTDHFRQSDYASLAGFNHGTKYVQLWHGVGIKYMGDLRNTTVPGVRWSRDILPRSEDGALAAIRRRLRYLRYARSRELMEEYFGFIVPGPYSARTADDWNVPQGSRIPAGYPRNSPLYASRVDRSAPRVLYAPTYRWSKEAETELVSRLCEAIPLVDQQMAAVNGHMAIRLHPHTWRDYGALLRPALQAATCVSLDESADIADSLGGYSVVITDYSSIAFDFMLLDRPCVFFCYDLADYERKEVNLAFEYHEYSPGAKTYTWEETLAAVVEYLKDPAKDHEWRQRILPSYWDPQVSGADSSERIVRALKQRLDI